ncbi:MAG: hypothetical protein ACI9SI_001550 [Polaribacter sp.]|jgi:hypothetical protein
MKGDSVSKSMTPFHLITKQQKYIAQKKRSEIQNAFLMLLKM